jgi:hypothetical protein
MTTSDASATPLSQGRKAPAHSRADIDADLARWTETAARIGKAIDGLTQDPAFLRLKAQGHLGALTGATKGRGEAAVLAAEQLWTLYLTLDKRLAEAAELRRSNNPFGREERFEKIDAILTGPSVALPSQPIGLAQMTLTGAPERLTPLAEVLSVMEAAFDAARDTVLAAARAWSRATELVAFGAPIAALKEETAALNCATPPSLAEAAKLIADAEAHIDSDPIGADDAAAKIAALIAKADLALASARADLADAKKFLAQAEARLADIAASHEKTTKLRADRTAKIKDPRPASAVPADATGELRAWLSTLAKTVSEGRPRAALIGAKSWTGEADKAVEQLAAIVAEDRKLLDARQDLRGRFSALTAKAEARAAENRLTPEAVALFNRTRALLFGAATPLPEAVALLRRCETI